MLDLDMIWIWSFISFTYLLLVRFLFFGILVYYRSSWICSSYLSVRWSGASTFSFLVLELSDLFNTISLPSFQIVVDGYSLCDYRLGRLLRQVHQIYALL